MPQFDSVIAEMARVTKANATTKTRKHGAVLAVALSLMASPVCSARYASPGALAGGAEGFGQRGQNPSQVEPLPEIPPHLQFVPLEVAERMLDLANVTRTDVVYDLGCGDGRVAILAAKKYGARSVGVDVDQKRIAEANANAEKAGVSNLVRFVQRPTIDVSEATVLTMSIPQSSVWLTQNGLLHPTLTGQLKAGSRIVTNFVSGSMKDWKPDRVDHFSDADGKARAIIYLWTVSSRIAGCGLRTEECGIESAIRSPRSAIQGEA